MPPTARLLVSKVGDQTTTDSLDKNRWGGNVVHAARLMNSLARWWGRAGHTHENDHSGVARDAAFDQAVRAVSQCW